MLVVVGMPLVPFAVPLPSAAVSNESASRSVFPRSNATRQRTFPVVAVVAIQVIRTLRPLSRSAASGTMAGKIALSITASSKSSTAMELRVSRVANRVAGGELSRGVNTAKVFVPEAPERMGVAIMRR